jgi:hypothetical protein
MGLRIIGRQHKRKAEITDTERLDCLEQEAENWVHARGTGDAAAKTNLIAHYKTVHNRMTTPDEIEAMANRIRMGIIMDTSPDKAPHQRVDIATLLELL